MEKDEKEWDGKKLGGRIGILIRRNKPVADEDADSQQPECVADDELIVDNDNKATFVLPQHATLQFLEKHRKSDFITHGVAITHRELLARVNREAGIIDIDNPKTRQVWDIAQSNRWRDIALNQQLIAWQLRGNDFPKRDDLKALRQEYKVSDETMDVRAVLRIERDQEQLYKTLALIDEYRDYLLHAVRATIGLCDRPRALALLPVAHAELLGKSKKIRKAASESLRHDPRFAGCYSWEKGGVACDQKGNPSRKTSAVRSNLKAVLDESKEMLRPPVRADGKTSISPVHWGLTLCCSERLRHWAELESACSLLRELSTIRDSQWEPPRYDVIPFVHEFTTNFRFARRLHTPLFKAEEGYSFVEISIPASLSALAMELVGPTPSVTVPSASFGNALLRYFAMGLLPREIHEAFQLEFGMTFASLPSEDRGEGALSKRLSTSDPRIARQRFHADRVMKAAIFEVARAGMPVVAVLPDCILLQTSNNASESDLGSRIAESVKLLVHPFFQHLVEVKLANEW